MRLCLFLLAALAVPVASAQDARLDSLVGTWTVDLRPTPDADAYTQPFVVRPSEALAFGGTFYGSPLETAVINDDWGDLRIAFTTSDGSGVYHHTAVLREGMLHGTTHSLGRDFLSVWTATRTR